jgi:hypothetical protein
MRRTADGKRERWDVEIAKGYRCHDASGPLCRAPAIRRYCRNKTLRALRASTRTEACSPHASAGLGGGACRACMARMHTLYYRWSAIIFKAFLSNHCTQWGRNIGWSALNPLFCQHRINIGTAVFKFNLETVIDWHITFYPPHSVPQTEHGKRVVHFFSSDHSTSIQAWHNRTACSIVILTIICYRDTPQKEKLLESIVSSII